MAVSALGSLVRLEAVSALGSLVYLLEAVSAFGGLGGCFGLVRDAKEF